MTGVARAAFIVLVAAPAPALACKYSVRDVGFVELDTDPFALVIAHDATTDAALVEQLRDRTRAALADTNVTPLSLDLTRDPAHPLVKRLGTLDRESLPQLWLMASHRQPAALDLPRAAGGAIDWVKLDARLAEVVDSPVRRELAERLVRGLGVVVLLEGDDDASNREARATAELVAGQIQRVLSRLEKPTKEGVSLVTVRSEDRGRERWLLWGLGEDPGRAAKARVAVVYGRFRRLGELFDGAGLDRSKLFTRLATLGTSCECSLDRAWLRGAALPHRWDDGQRRRVAKALDFDPEHPLVKAEVGALLDKPASGKPPPSPATFEELLSGYKEQDLDDGPAPPEPKKPENSAVNFPPIPQQPPAATPAPEQGGGAGGAALWTLAGVGGVSLAAAVIVFLVRLRRA